MAGERKTLTRRIDRHAIRSKFTAEHVSETARQRIAPSHGGIIQAAAALACDGKAYTRMRDRKPLDDIGDGLALGALAFQEFQPRRDAGKEIAHFDACPFYARTGTDCTFLAKGHRNARAMRRFRRPRFDQKLCHRADRGQRLTPKAERGDSREVAVRQFRRRVAVDAEREIVGRHPMAVVADADQPPPASLDHDFDPRRAGVERVLDEFLHRRGGTLDDLARGDAIDEDRVQAANPGKGRRIEGGGKRHRLAFSRPARTAGARFTCPARGRRACLVCCLSPVIFLHGLPCDGLQEISRRRLDTRRVAISNR